MYTCACAYIYIYVSIYIYIYTYTYSYIDYNSSLASSVWNLVSLLVEILKSQLRSLFI